MKKYIHFALLTTLGILTTQKIKAVKEHRSLSSKMLEDFGHHYIHFPNIKDPKIYKKALERSKKGFIVPKYVNDLYSFHYNHKYSNTLERIPSGKNPTRTIFYLHGGAFWNDPLLFHFSALKKLSEDNNARIIMPIYPKAPYYNAQQALKFVEKNYRVLLSESDNIIIMGDSSGGGMALSFMQIMRDKKAKLPKKAILLSPWLDITNTNPEIKNIYQKDILLGDYKSLAFQGQKYAGNLDLKDPKVSPIYGELSNLPPIYQFIGSHDIFYADVSKLQSIADKNNYNIHTYYFDKMIHVFSVVPIPEGLHSLKMIGDIIKGID